ncbi:Dabb family protein [Galbibacter sp. EGI 63066]|uniref:Dabb family protein n=1 Tax=Galbibacter sp. EGI 63066 TaxID=2993559 RepID=UPI002249859C|nr:Dabb family protein [Galbibacter sp. EGI 63066]MCX2681582.1 Dabb family protein [Galbibacter sp. EGI 63066]
MKLRNLIPVLALTLFFTLNSCNNTPEKGTITHTVFFKLKHPQGSEAEKVFIEKAVGLKSISTVMNMTCVKEVSKKNDFDWGLTMQFKNQADYDTYTKHPDHVAFVENIWLKEVEDFMEIDYVDTE